MIEELAKLGERFDSSFSVGTFENGNTHRLQIRFSECQKIHVDVHGEAPTKKVRVVFFTGEFLTGENWVEMPEFFCHEKALESFIFNKIESFINLFQEVGKSIDRRLNEKDNVT
jgi:hypothetical protein